MLNPLPMPPSTQAEICWCMCLQIHLQTSPPTHKKSYTKFQDPRKTVHRSCFPYFVSQNIDVPSILQISSYLRPFKSSSIDVIFPASSLQYTTKLQMGQTMIDTYCHYQLLSMPVLLVNLDQNIGLKKNQFIGDICCFPGQI